MTELADNTVAKGERAAACDLFQRLKTEPGNLFFSPYSITEALAMARDGAVGVTADEIARAMHLPDADSTASGLARLREHFVSLKKVWGFELACANRLWPMAGFPLQPRYIKRAESLYRAGIEAVDFAESQAAAGRINDWVARETHERIKNLVNPGALNERTRLILTNAIYFKAAWMNPFEPTATETGDFHADGKTVKAKMMRDNDMHSYASIRGDIAQALELFYKGGISMLVLLPRQGKLAELESALTPRLLDEIDTSLHLAKVDLSLPRFKIEGAFSLNQTLKGMGIVTAFTPLKADFTGIAAGDALFISDAIHKSFVDINEEGTEAAAATALMFAAGCAMPRAEEIVKFTADRPFLFLIRDRASGAVLFMGRVADPA